MGYPRDLDDYTEEELNAELARRQASRRRGLCDYCGRVPQSTEACSKPERHRAVQQLFGDFVPSPTAHTLVEDNDDG